MEELQNVESADPPVDAVTAAPHPSAIRKVFRNRFDQWRAGWRILVYLILLVLGNLALSALVRALFPESDGGMMSWTYSLALAGFDLMAIAAGILVLRRFDWRPASLLGMGVGRGWLWELAIGVVVGIVSTGVLTLVLVLSGMVSLELSPRAAEALAVLPRYLVVFTVAAAAEELIFRGYLLQALAEGSRRWLAAVLLSLGFAVVHLGNPDITVVGIANIFLVGLVIAILYFQTLRLWLPIGYHLSWNLAHGWLWGFDVSGIELEHKVLIATPNGPDLVTGGGFGLEGSVLTTALVVAAGVWLLTRKVLIPTSEMTAMWAPYPRGFGLAPIVDSETDMSQEAVVETAVDTRGEDEPE
jgi:membrane protease YdiL (CAAX protease family)